MKKLLLCIVLCLELPAQEKKHKHSKTQSAHEHGTAQINLAVEGKAVDIELHVPAMGIVGFEYVPSTPADKKKQADSLARLKANIARIVIFDPALACKISTKSVEIEQEEPDHAEIDGHFRAVCEQSPGGTKVSFGLTKHSSAIGTVKVQAIGSAGSVGADIQNDIGSIVLPK